MVLVMHLWLVLYVQPLPQTQFIILLCCGSFPGGFEPENLLGSYYLFGGLVINTGLLGTGVLESFSMMYQNKKLKEKKY